MQRDSALADYRRLIIALALNTPIILIIFLWNLMPVEFSVLTWIYFITVSVGYYVLAMWLVTTIVFVMLLPFRRVGIGLCAVMTGAFVYYFLIDSFVFRLTRMHIDPFWIEWIVSDFGAFGISGGTLRSALLALLLIAAIEYGLFHYAWRITVKKFITVSFYTVGIASLIISQVIHAMAYEYNDARITKLTPYLPVYYPVSSHNQAAKYGGRLPIGNDESIDIEGEEGDAVTYPLRELEMDKPEGKRFPNILVLLFESWRYDMMNADITPHTYALSRNSLVCSRHYCSGNSTVAGVFGLFYGLFPTYWTTVKANNKAIHNPVLIDVLENNRYNYGVFANSNFKRHKIKDAVFRDIEVQESFAGESKIEQDLDMTRQLIGFLREQQGRERPFFALGFYKSNHAPYLYPQTDTIFRPAGDQNLMRANSDTDPTLYFNDYKNATHFVDKLIGQVLQEIDSLGLMSNTIIIVTTDHGEEFNDDRSNYWGHGTNFTQFQTVVPLVIYAPGREPRMITQITSHVDIAPTLLQEFLFCINNPGDYSNGINLYRDFGDNRPMVIGSYVNYAIILDDNVYEIYPFRSKNYKLSNINKDVAFPAYKELTPLMDEMKRFYRSSQQWSLGGR
ncbi:putative Sulfatase domain protein [Candidatus Zixiibacteriota bacterium]|nr:putative Sulfatase domain protein [candidate division Zixibacteria bacterium]